MSKCKKLKELLGIEVELLRKEIELDRWYLAEKEHRHISWDEAEQHYINTHLNGWAAGAKDIYCNYVCDIEDCKYRRRLSK